MNIELFDILETSIRKLNIHHGDIVYICGDVTQILNIAIKKFGLDLNKEKNFFFDCLTDILCNIVGVDGTIIFPAYTWAFCKGECFSIKNSPATVGIWNDWILHNRIDFTRTRHPIYSFMVKGKDADLLKMMDNQQAFGKDSPFGYLDINHAKQLFLNLDTVRGFTFLHYVEQCLKVPYRYHKYFIGDYIDENECISKRCYSMYVRDMSIHSKEAITDEFFCKNNLAQIEYSCGIKLLLLHDLNLTYKFIHDDFMHGACNCYKFENYELNFNHEKTHKNEIAYYDGDNIWREYIVY